MNNITYGIVKEMRYCKDMERVSYGIAAYLDYKEDDMGTVVASGIPEAIAAAVLVIALGKVLIKIYVSSGKNMGK